MACALLEGQVVRVDDLPPGWSALRTDRRPPLACLYCGGAVTPRGRRFAHVARKPDPPDVPGSFGAAAPIGDAAACRTARSWGRRQGGETDWHRGAKQVLAGTTGLRVPAIVRDGLVLAPARWLDGVLVLQLETRLGRVRVDALASYAEQPFGVEITVTHAMGRDKLEEASRMGLALLEIDLRDLAAQPWDEEVARAVVIDGVHRKRWHLPSPR